MGVFGQIQTSHLSLLFCGDQDLSPLKMHLYSQVETNHQVLLYEENHTGAGFRSRFVSGRRDGCAQTLIKWVL